MKDVLQHAARRPAVVGSILVILSLLARTVALDDVSDILPDTLLAVTLAAGLILVIFAFGCNSSRP
jgi:uncharacterized membrane protein